MFDFMIDNVDLKNRIRDTMCRIASGNSLEMQIIEEHYNDHTGTCLVKEITDRSTCFYWLIQVSQDDGLEPDVIIVNDKIINAIKSL